MKDRTKLLLQQDNIYVSSLLIKPEVAMN